MENKSTNADNRKIIYLTGFMGSGKTTVGKALAELLAVPFTDLDSDIEARAGMSIPRIFAERGESGFREEETKALIAAAECFSIIGIMETHMPDRGIPSAVISCGGGIVLSPENRGIMRASGTVVHLSVSAEEAIRRLSGDTGRPLVNGKSPEEIASLLSERLPLYEEAADFAVNTDGREPSDIALEIETLIE